MIRYLHILWTDHHDKSSNHLSTHKVITILLTIFLKLFTSLFLNYSVIEGLYLFSQSVQLLSRVWLFVTPWTAAHQASLSITNSQSLLKFISIELVMSSNSLSHLLSSPSPPAFNLCQDQGLFQWVGSSHQVAKVLELQLQHQFLQWIFRIDFL